MNEADNKIELIRKAFEKKSQKHYEEAVSFLKEALKINVNVHENAEIYAQIGEIHLLMNEVDLALNDFQKALSIDGSHKFSIQKCFDIYFEKEQYQKALRLAQKICENEKNATSYYDYFKVLYKLGKYQDIIEIFNSLNEEIKLEPEILYLLSLVDVEKKEALLRKVLELDDAHKNANLDLAKISFEKKDYNTTIKCCINLDENIPEVSYYLGIINSKPNPTKSIEYLINAIKYDNNKNDYYFDLAKIYIDITYYTEALECLNQSIKYSLINDKKENLDEKYFLSGWILFKKQEFQNALLNLNLVNEKSKFYTNSKILIQAINLKNENLAQAKETLEKIYLEQPENKILLDTLAMVYKNLKNPKKAIEIYKKALALSPESLFYKLELIDLYIDINLYSEAMAQIDTIIQTNKNCANIYNSLARIYYRLKDYTNALTNIEEYLKLDKNNAESFYFKGLILNEIKEYQKAKSSIYSAITLNPNNAKYYFQMAKSYFGMNEFENALLYAKEAVELNPNEINYKKQILEIAQKIGNKEQIEFYEKQLKRSESILKSF